MKPLASKDKPDAILPKATTIGVWFVFNFPVKINIREKIHMKTKIQNQNQKPVIPDLFQIASRMEDFTVSPGLALGPMPFAELMLNPMKLEAVLRTFKKRAALAYC